MAAIEYRYKILRDQHLILKYYKGEYTFVDFVATMLETAENADFSPNMYVLNDLRDTIIHADVEAVEKFVQLVQANQALYAKRKIVFLTSSPNQTAFSYLVQSLAGESLVNIFTASTAPAAMEHLQLPRELFLSIEASMTELRQHAVA